jgi:hypothetical protein
MTDRQGHSGGLLLGVWPFVPDGQITHHLIAKKHMFSMYDLREVAGE